MAVKQWKLDTWLKRAVLEDDIDDARRALDAGGNCNQSVEVNGVNSTLLIQAVFKHIALMQLLLDHGADVNWIGHDRKTACDVALEGGEPGFIEWLRGVGAKRAVELV